jgi:hypothetical protein
MDERLPDIRITVEPDPDTFAAEIETRLLDSLDALLSVKR